MRCRLSRVPLQAARLLLLASWVVLTGHQLKHYLSEPTALRPRIDWDFAPPFLTVVPAKPLPRRVARVVENGTAEERRALYGNQTLLDFIKEHSLTLAQLIGEEAGAESGDDGRAQTEAVGRFGFWRLIRTGVGVTGATLEPNSSQLFLSLPRNTEFEMDLGGGPAGQYCCWVIVHSTRDFFKLDMDRHAFFPIRNVFDNPDVQLTVSRDERLNLRRLPCERDPAYSEPDCERRCFLGSLRCSLETDRPAGRPACMAADYQWFTRQFRRFLQPTSSRDKSSAPSARCGCPRPCTQDRYSYSPLSDVTVITNQTFRMAITVRRIRRTMVTVLTYKVEDLLADAGGYLGLLLGFSALSLFGSVERLARRVLRRARRAAAVRSGADRPPSDRRLSVPRRPAGRSVSLVHDDRLSIGPLTALDDRRGRTSLTEW